MEIGSFLRKYQTLILYLVLFLCICVKYSPDSCRECVKSAPKETVYDPSFLHKPHFFAVDFVYTYVNGSDPDLLKDLDFKHKKGGQSSDNRFRDYDTLKYSFRSIVKYAPWFRNLYLIVANNSTQVPSWIDRSNPRIRIITHADIFENRENHLPSFNSHAIEAHMWRIRDLSNYFVYFNDDVLLGSDVVQDDFFDMETGQIIIYPQERFSVHTIYTQRNVYRNTFNLLDYYYSEFSSDMIDIYSERHTPHALKKDLMSRVWYKWPLDMEFTSRHQERTGTDISIFVLLYNWIRIDPKVWGIQMRDSYMSHRSQYILLERKYEKFFLRHDLFLWRLLKPKFVCINDKIFIVDERQRATLGLLHDFLEDYYSEPSEFEIK